MNTSPGRHRAPVRTRRTASVVAAAAALTALGAGTAAADSDLAPDDPAEVTTTWSDAPDEFPADLSAPVEDLPPSSVTGEPAGSYDGYDPYLDGSDPVPAGDGLILASAGDRTPSLGEIAGRWHFEATTNEGPAGFWFDFDEPDELGAGDMHPIAGGGTNAAAFAVRVDQSDAAAWDGRTTGTYHYDPRSGILQIQQGGYVGLVTGKRYLLNISVRLVRSPADGGGLRASDGGLFNVVDTAGNVVGGGVLNFSPPGSGRNILH